MHNTRRTLQHHDLPSSQQLKRSTLLAFCGATILMIAVVLPAEYGHDPTGIGSVLGLTEMGRIKQTLAQEAAAQKKADKAGATAAKVPEKALEPASAPSVAMEQSTGQSPPPAADTAKQKHEMQITLAPDEGVEVKLEMKQGAKTNFEWTVQGGLVNFDAHGDPYNAPPNFFHGYKKGRQVKGDKGVLVAAFDGRHGWFFRNRDKQPVTIKLLTQGDYLNIKRAT